jgi:signal transduction histidine kinase
MSANVNGTSFHHEAFAAHAAHELRTPLAAMRARIELALSRPRSAKSYRAALQEALAIERRLETLVENLLLLNRPHREEPGFAMAAVALTPLLAQTWSDFFDRAEARHLRVSLCLPPDGLEVRTGKDLLAVVLRNLFDNAVSYAPPGGRIEISAAATVAGCEISVANTNPGLGLQETRRVFEPFWRAGGEIASASHHTGIGLTLCQRVVGKLGGTINVRLTPGNLFAVAVILPAA